MNNEVAKQDTAKRHESFSELLGQLVKKLTAVVHDEIQLVIQRIREKVKAALSGVIIIVTGAALGFAAFICLCAAVIIELTSYMTPAMAAFVTGVAVASAGMIIVFIGYGHLKKQVRKL